MFVTLLFLLREIIPPWSLSTEDTTFFSYLPSIVSIVPWFWIIPPATPTVELILLLLTVAFILSIILLVLLKIIPPQIIPPLAFEVLFSKVASILLMYSALTIIEPKIVFEVIEFLLYEPLIFVTLFDIFIIPPWILSTEDITLSS